MAETKNEAVAALDAFAESYAPKYASLTKDRDAEVVHIDSSLIRANVSCESLVARHVDDVLSENQTEEELEAERKRPAKRQVQEGLHD